MFIHLHNHTEFSLLDGATRVDALVDRVSELGQSAVAITDHGWMAGAIKLTKACKAKDIKPIIGSEVYIASQEDMSEKAANGGDNFHLTLLCANRDGYANLRRLTSLAYIKGFHYKPRIDRKTLAANAAGIIALSGCIAAELPQAIIDGDSKRAKRLIDFYTKTFGKRFFIELMAHGSTGGVDHVSEKRDGVVVMGEGQLNAELVRLANLHSIPLVATNDAHYLMGDDGDAHDTLLCMQMGTKKDDPKRMRFPGAEHAAWEFFVKTEKEMKAMSKNKAWKEACDNTAEVARLVETDVIPMGQTVLPKFQIPHDDMGYVIWQRTGLLL